MSLLLLIALVGASGQLIDTVAGMGFGAFSSSAMVSVGIAPAVVISIVNVAKIGSGLSSGLAHWRFGNVKWKWVAPLAAPGVAGGIAGALLLTRLPVDVARTLVPVLLIAMGVVILRRFVFLAGAAPRVAGGSQDAAATQPVGWLEGVRRRLPRRRSNKWLVGIGFGAGSLNALSGAFGPFATSSVLMAKGGHPRYVVGTVSVVEIFVAASISATLLLSLDWRDFRWELPAALVASSMVTAPVGAYLARFIPARAFGASIGVVLVLLNLYTLSRVI